LVECSLGSLPQHLAILSRIEFLDGQGMEFHEFYLVLLWIKSYEPSSSLMMRILSYVFLWPYKSGVQAQLKMQLGPLPKQQRPHKLLALLSNLSTSGTLSLEMSQHY
jgi:hypothetical protein